MSVYTQLDQALNVLKGNVNALQQTMTEVRAFMANDDSWIITWSELEQIANKELNRLGYDDEPSHKLEQWGIHACRSKEEVWKIIAEVVNNRWYKAQGN